MRAFALITAALVAISAPPHPARAQATPKGSPAAVGGVCDLQFINGGADLASILTKARTDLAAAGCRAGDIVRIVTDKGLASNVLPEAVCDYRQHIVMRPDTSSFRNVSCVYSGSVRIWRQP